MGLNKHICVFCNKEFKNYFKEAKYCSQDCYKEHRKLNAKLKNHTCPNCGEIFDAHDSGTIYCSKKCAGEARQNRVECVCDNCGKTFVRPEYMAERHDGKFCSQECFAESTFWSKEDEQILLDNYGKLSYESISSLLSRDIKPHSICRKATDMGIVKPTNIWSDIEIKILIENYSIKPMSEMLRLLPNRSQSAIFGQARKHGLKSYFYLNRSYSEDEIEYIKNNYIDKTYDEMSNELGRTIVAIKARMYILDLHKPMETANYNNLYNYVRQRIIPWRNNVRESNGYICEVSGKRSNIVVHHTRGFNLLLEECIDVLDFPLYDDFGLYTQEQLGIFGKTFLELQEYYGSYVCITEDIHKKFHSIYGYGDNTQEQWDEFIKSISIK